MNLDQKIQLQSELAQNEFDLYMSKKANMVKTHTGYNHICKDTGKVLAVYQRPILDKTIEVKGTTICIFMFRIMSEAKHSCRFFVLANIAKADENNQFIDDQGRVFKLDKYGHKLIHTPMFDKSKLKPCKSPEQKVAAQQSSNESLLAFSAQNELLAHATAMGNGGIEEFA